MPYKAGSQYLRARLDAGLLAKLGEELHRENRRLGGGPGPIGAAFHAAGAVYMGFTRERFVRFSRGGGTWPPLAASTLRRRRKGNKVQGKRNADLTRAIFNAQGRPAGASILHDTGTLLGSITPGQHQTEKLVAGVRVGTQVEYSRYHQRGGWFPGRPPKRQIFVQPDHITIEKMEGRLEAGYQRAVNQRGGQLE